MKITQLRAQPTFAYNEKLMEMDFEPLQNNKLPILTIHNFITFEKLIGFLLTYITYIGPSAVNNVYVFYMAARGLNSNL